ncbi:MAG: extracellular solute-binding protein [Clostridia bacterium]|nr:extracellular solute-binding protein [Clostridia bacterium]
MKKLFAMLLVLALLLCASGAMAEKIKLTGMCWGSTGQYDQLIADVFAVKPELAEKYEVTWVLAGEGDGNSAEKIRLALSANENLCDFCVLNYTQVPEFARAEVLVDIGETVKKYEDVMTESAKNLIEYEGKIVGAPFEVKTKVWFYRSDIFEECGVKVEEIVDVDSFIAAGKKIQEKYPNSYMWNLGTGAPGYSYYLTLSGNGASFFDEDGNYNIATDEGTRKMLEDYKKMVDAGVIANISDWTPDWESGLADGTILTQPCAAWLGQDIFLPTYSGEGNEWKVTTWPVIGGTDAGSDAGGSVWVVPVFSSNAEAAADLLTEVLLSEEGSKVVFKMNGSLPQNTEALKDEALFAESAKGYFGDTFVNAQKAAFDKYAVFNYSPNASAEQTIVCEYFAKAIYGEMTIDEALEAAQADLEIMIGNAFN